MKPLRILHVLGAMNRGGVETWLLHVLRHTDRGRIQMDFLVHTGQPAAYDAEVLALGSRIFPCPHTHSPMRYAGRFLEIARQFGPFDVLHSHSHHFSGYVLWLGRLAGIPIRISHSHNDIRGESASAGLRRKAYWRLCKWLIKTNCTHALAASPSAAEDLFGEDWQRDRRAEVLFCGVDLAPFRLAADRRSVRSELGFHGDEILFGHVGRFDPQKNHRFLAEIAAEIAKREPRARFLLVGDGPLRPDIENRFRQAGIGDLAVFTGSRPDVPRLVLGAMDAFLFPSIHEGLPLALVEAQAAGLAATISDTIAPEADFVPALIHRLSLRQSAATWAESALRHCERSVPDALEIVERSSFNVIASAKHLLEIYSA